MHTHSRGDRPFIVAGIIQLVLMLLLLLLLAPLSGCGGGSGSPSTSGTLTVNAGGPYSGTTGSAIALNGSASSSAGATIVSYAWDLNDDGVYDDASGSGAEFSSTTPGTYTIGLQATDSEGDTASATTTVTVSDGGPYAGYNLYAPLKSTTVYLMDNDGNTVHTWDTGYNPGLSVYLLDDGELLHTANAGNTTFVAGGAGGIVQLLDWDGTVTWQYEYSDTTHLQHHDVAELPNGDILMIAWEYKSESEAIAAGRDPSLLTDGALWPDSVIEVKPSGSDSGTIVWEWHVWDHLIQDYDSSESNYGVVADHPERIDLNYASNGGADWTHINGIDYDADHDQILLSVHNFSEIWVIDHSTTTAEAAGHSGGNSGKGGDLLYRWGNPQAYGAGTSADQQLFGQHDAHWIASGLPGAGDILIFNNGTGRPGGNYSSIDEIVPPVNSDGSYTLTAGSAYGPDAPVWSYTAPTPTDFYASNISSAQRLPNGDTLVCNGPNSYFFEVDSAGTLVWDYDAGAGSIFRVVRYATDYSGFSGKSL